MDEGDNSVLIFPILVNSYEEVTVRLISVWGKYSSHSGGVFLYLIVWVRGCTDGSRQNNAGARSQRPDTFHVPVNIYMTRNSPRICFRILKEKGTAFQGCCDLPLSQSHDLGHRSYQLLHSFSYFLFHVIFFSFIPTLGQR